jgi:hypothetical protein
MIEFNDFARVEMRVGRKHHGLPLGGGDAGDALAERQSRALRHLLDARAVSRAEHELAAIAALVGQVVCVVNFLPRRIAGFASEVLLLGAMGEGRRRRGLAAAPTRGATGAAHRLILGIRRP